MLTRRDLANAVRVLSMDAVQKANSGHPGAPMGMADIAQVLWNDFLRFNPGNPHWPDRDRFVLSNGHASMLLYSILHLTGYDLPMAEIKQFRQLHSMTPGHPEVGCAPGVETTTGPLGQGLANAVGMAVAERTLAARFNRDDLDIINHHTYVSVGDGCLMEGISHEACSLAGTLGLGKLIAIYDDNGISIDGEVRGWFTEDEAARFEAYNWHVIRAVDGHDAEQVQAAITEARAVTDRPTLIDCRTIIGWGSPNKQGKETCHGAALGEEEVKLVRETLGWTHPPFEIPEEYYRGWDARARGAALERDWNDKFERYRGQYPDLAAELERRLQSELPDDWDGVAEAALKEIVEKAESEATRKASQGALNAYGPILPELIGGSADLTGSNQTWWSGSTLESAAQPGGNYLHYGVREFAMTAINSGIALHRGFIPYGGTFLVFSDYARNAVRLAALMKQRNILVYTHDSIGLGEDGPTHQAVEQAASLRLIPNLSVWRPADTVETMVAWRAAIERTSGPTALLLSRQSLPYLERSPDQIRDIARGAYILLDTDGEPEAIILATGSETSLALEAGRQLDREGRRVRVVSMPSTDVFDAQDAAYREAVLPTACRRRVAVEAGIPDYWRRYVGLDGAVMGVPTFGESAPGPAVYEHFGISADNLVELVKSLF
jgi:transketolase